jgi:transcription elongation GreA/GreB family factor
MEQKLMDSKIKTLEERLAREKLISATQKSSVKFAIENEVHCRVMQTSGRNLA